MLLISLLTIVIGSPVQRSQYTGTDGRDPSQLGTNNPVNFANHVRTRRAAKPHQFIGGFMRMFEQAEWDVIFIKMTRVLVNYFTDMGFKMVFGQTGRSLDSAGPFRSFEIMDRLHDRIKKNH